jgi:hypothetical protein
VIIARLKSRQKIKRKNTRRRVSHPQDCFFVGFTLPVDTFSLYRLILPKVVRIARGEQAAGYVAEMMDFM